MSNMPVANHEQSAEALRQLAQQKEQEWKRLQELRLESLEAAVLSKDQELAEERSRMAKLKLDFKYNLQLLNDRHAELETYDGTLAELKRNQTVKEAEISDLKICVDDLKKSLLQETRSREDLQGHYQHRLREKQAEVDQYRSAKDQEIQRERVELENVKRSLERQLREVEDETETQRRELTAEFDAATRKLEHDYRIQLDEVKGALSTHEIQVKLLNKELELSRAAAEQASTERGEVESSQRDVEKQLQQVQWELKDATAMKDARIQDLESEVKKAEQAMKRAQENFQRKYAELDRLLHEKEATICKVRQAGQEREQILLEKIRSLEAQLETEQLKCRQVAWANQDLEREKQAALEKAETELEEARSKWELQQSSTSQSAAARDMELSALQEHQAKLNTELLQRKQDIARYKKDLQEALQEKSTLESSKAQLELDWQRRYEELQGSQYERSEDLIKTLTKAKTEALAELKLKERELSDKTDLLQVMSEDRDRAMATLKHHGLVIDHQINPSLLENLPSSSAEQIENLQTQNENLRSVVSHMRSEMESLGHTMDDPKEESSSKQPIILQAYTKNLEEELLSWKAKYRQLVQEKSGDTAEPSSADILQLTAAGDNTVLRTHVDRLNNIIGDLRQEKTELAAQLRKQQTRLQHQEASLEQQAKQPREQQVALEQAQYELGAVERRTRAQVQSLKQQLADHQLQLEQACKEADEYHRASVQSNMEITGLNKQISSLKLELAEKRQPVSFGAQELVIQQLEDEIERLRGIHKGLPDMDPGPTAGPAGRNPTVGQLQAKLRQAARFISQLAREKQQLIELGNRLRAQLMQNEVSAVPRSRPVIPEPPHVQKAEVTKPPTELSEKIHNKLNQLEQLQYQLTKQELSLAQQRSLASQEEPRKSSLKQSEYHNELALDKGSFTAKRPSTAPSEPPMSSRLPQPVDTGGEPELSSSQGRGLAAHVMASASSFGGESLQEIWKMLDEEGFSPRPFTPYEGSRHQTPRILEDLPEMDTNPSSSESFTVKGKHSNIKVKAMTKPKVVSNKVLGKPVKKATSKPYKIRNYNLKDDQL